MNRPKLSNQDLPLGEDPLSSYTLPSRWYLDAEIFQLEKQAIFYREWHYISHISRLSNPGDYATLQIADENVFVIRGDDEVLRGFYNVCRHRAHQLVAGSGNTSDVVCPYHAWRYDKTGRLCFARNTQDIRNFNKSAYGLHEVRVEVLCGLVFVNLDPNAESLARRAAGLEDDLRRWVPDLDELTAVDYRNFGDDSGIRANWKVVVDNYVECYHCEKAHPAFADLNCMRDYQLETFGLWSRQLGPVTRTDNSAYEFSADAPVQTSAFWYVWPTTTINIIPGDTMVQVLSILPLDLESTTFAGHTLATKPEHDSARLSWLFGTLAEEDQGLCESVQKGLKSRSYSQGPFVADGENSGIGEHALHHFHCLVRDALSN